MAIVNTSDLGIGLEVRGKINQPSEYGTRIYGIDEYGGGADIAGIYQVRTRWGHRTQVKMKFYVPFNPQSEAQTAWRAIFTAGVSAWQALTESAKNVYRARAEYLPLTGFNLYLREHLLSQ